MPTGDEEPPEFANPKGQVPVARVREILTNARTKEHDRVDAEYRESYGIDAKTAKEIDVASHLSQFLKDPTQYWRDLGAELERAGVKLSWGAPAAPAKPAAQTNGLPAVPDALPEPDMQGTDGTPAYSAPKMLEAFQFLMAQYQQKLDARLQPVDGLLQAQERQKIQTQANDWAQTKYKELQTWVGWKEIEKDVAALMKKDARYSVEGAYMRILQENYLPSLNARNRQAVLDELNKAPAAKTVTPNEPTIRAAGSGKSRGGADWDTAIRDAIDKVAAQ